MSEPISAERVISLEDIQWYIGGLVLENIRLEGGIKQLRNELEIIKREMVSISDREENESLELKSIPSGEIGSESG